jgi:hypothetical protein
VFFNAYERKHKSGTIGENSGRSKDEINYTKTLKKGNVI